MAFKLFKKKEDDDFSDFSSSPRLESSSLDNNNGLPLNADITNVSGNNYSNNLGLPAEDETHNTSAPSSFNDFNNMKSQRAFSMSQQQEIDNSVQEMSHKPTRTELMTKVNNLEKDMEIVTAKLDTIKSLLETINHRLTHIEKAAEQSGYSKEEVKW